MKIYESNIQHGTRNIECPGEFQFPKFIILYSLHHSIFRVPCWIFSFAFSLFQCSLFQSNVEQLLLKLFKNNPQPAFSITSIVDQENMRYILLREIKQICSISKISS